MQEAAQKFLRLSNPYLYLAVLLPLLYVCGLESDTIAGMFGIFAGDEGLYLLSAKNHAVSGQAHLLAHDRWQPELIAPLLNGLARLTMTPGDTVFGPRLTIALLDLCGAGLMARIAWAQRKSAAEAAACFAFILLNPVLFFYARLGLSEGIQFFILTCILASVYGICSARSTPRAQLFAALGGGLTALLFIAKISAFIACGGCGIGLLAAAWANTALTTRQKLLAAACVIIGGLAVSYGYFGIMLEHDFPQWWRVNILAEAVRRVPWTARIALGSFTLKMVDIAYYLSLMPVFALYFWALPLAARQHGIFIRILAIMTIIIILGESCLGGDIRRNFFSLIMLGILCGFTVTEYLRQGVTWRPAPWLAVIALLVVAAHLLGMGWLIAISAGRTDWIYAGLCATFLLMALLIGGLRGERFVGARRLLVLLAVIGSLMPMLFQAFFAPYTIRDVSRIMESLVPADTTITGSLFPWYFPGVRRRTIATNCTRYPFEISFANDRDSIPLSESRYYISDIEHYRDVCAPPDFDAYHPVADFAIFDPENHGGWLGGSKNWTFHYLFYLYAK